MPTTSTPARKIPPLRDVRRARGKSLRSVAGSARIDPGHLSKVERGEAMLSVDALHRLAVVLELRELAGMLALYLPDESGQVAA